MPRHIRKTMTPAVVAYLAMTLAACDSSVYDEDGDCESRYNICFRFTKNVLNADAFGSQVSDIHVAVYDREGNLLFTQSGHRDLTEDNSYLMPVDLRPGEYDIMAWCEGPAMSPGAVRFSLTGQATYSHISSSGAYFAPQGDAQSGFSFQSDLVPLYYGRAEGVVCLESDFGDLTLPPISLTKDTNAITVMLQNLGGQPLDPDMLTFTIQGANSALDWRNELTATEKTFDYHPWDTDPLRTVDDTGISEGLPSGVKAEFTTGRLFANREQRLTVSLRDSGEEILSIPLIEYLLLVRSYYQQAVSAQDYLDRVDTYSLVFFIDENHQWIKSRVLINGWRVVPPQSNTL